MMNHLLLLALFQIFVIQTRSGYASNQHRNPPKRTVSVGTRCSNFRSARIPAFQTARPPTVDRSFSSKSFFGFHQQDPRGKPPFFSNHFSTEINSVNHLSDNSIHLLPSFLPWVSQLVSAAFFYIGFVTYFDRPRGTLQVDPSVLRLDTSTVPNSGLGVFVTEPLPKGTVLGTYPGVLVPLSDNTQKGIDYPECIAYIWRFQDSAFVLDPTNPFNGSMSGGISDTDETFSCVGGHDHYPLSRELFSLVYSRCVPPRWDIGRDKKDYNPLERQLSRTLGPVPTILARINEPPSPKQMQALQQQRNGDSSPPFFKPKPSINVETEEDLAQRTVTFQLSRDVEAGEELFLDYGPTYDRSGYTS
jgi:hypothetical protein